MNKIGCSIIEYFRFVTVIGIVFATWRLVRHCRTNMVDKTGHAIGASIGADANKLGNAAAVIEEWANSGLGESPGKGLDDALTDAKRALEKATGLVRRALNHAK
jgi:hypothetical protein